MFDKLFNKTNVMVMNFQERRHRSRSAEPARKARESDIFNRKCKAEDAECFSSEYKKSFAWPSNQTNTTEIHHDNADAVDGAIASRPASTVPFVYTSLPANGVSRSITVHSLSAANGEKDNLSRVDAAQLAQKLAKMKPHFESTYGKKPGADVLFQSEPVTTAAQLQKHAKKTEYRSKFKPFSTYVYLPGNGWIKPKHARAVSATPAENGSDIVDGLPAGCQPWFEEVAERAHKASEFRSRSQYGNPILGRQNLEEIYKRASGNVWHASEDARSLCQLQKMRTTNSVFDKSIQNGEDLKSPCSSRASASSTLKKPRRALSMPPRSGKNSVPRSPSTTNNGNKPKPVSRPNASQANTEKVWIKPNQEPKIEESAKSSQQNGEKTIKAQSSPLVPTGPVRMTDIKSPEELSGVKSPPPENWLVSMDEKPIDWTNSATSARVANAFDNLMDPIPSQTASLTTNSFSADRTLFTGLS